MRSNKNSIIILFLLTLVLNMGLKPKDPTSFQIEMQVPPGSFDSLSYHFSNESFTAYSLKKFVRKSFDSTGYVYFNVRGVFYPTKSNNRKHYSYS